MKLPDISNSRKGHYLGTEIDGKWWKRYRKDKMFARGNGEYWFDGSILYFRRYLTRQPIRIDFSKVTEIKIGRSHAGRFLWGSRVLKLIWQQDGEILSSGFVVARNQQETEAIMAEIEQLLG